MERRHRHDIIKTQKTCDYCDRTHSASSWQMGRWVRRCLNCYALYRDHRMGRLRFEIDGVQIQQPTRMVKVGFSYFKAVDEPTGIEMRMVDAWARAE